MHNLAKSHFLTWNNLKQFWKFLFKFLEVNWLSKILIILGPKDTWIHYNRRLNCSYDITVMLQNKNWPYKNCLFIKTEFKKIVRSNELALFQIKKRYFKWVFGVITIMYLTFIFLADRPDNSITLYFYKQSYLFSKFWNTKMSTDNVSFSLIFIISNKKRFRANLMAIWKNLNKKVVEFLLPDFEK